ncbi:MAG: UbiA prenyltransferase family protein, partial [Dysgonamonadaceae bacterium]|nr:UbiA prenyltransferase family protein [Dysgonamonadaceae bacterium]
MKDYIQLLRPSQWLKNLFVFLLLFFSGQLMTDVDCIVSTIAVFAAWCFAASAIYCFNDIRDMNDDRLHPVKRHRPLASGAISTAKAYIVMTCCLVAGLLFLLPVRGSGVLPVVLLYLLIDLAYSLRLKHVALLDVFILSAGFVLRILAGAFVSEVWISQWIVVMTFLLALFLSFAKRRDDLVI